MTYTPKLPPRSAILDAWGRAHPFQLSSTPEDREIEFDLWEAKVKAVAWEEGFTAGYDDLKNADTSKPLPQNPYRETS